MTADKPDVLDPPPPEVHRVYLWPDRTVEVVWITQQGEILRIDRLAFTDREPLPPPR